MKESLDIEDLLSKARTNLELSFLFLFFVIIAIFAFSYFKFISTTAYVSFVIMFLLVAIFLINEAFAYRRLRLFAEFLDLINVEDLYISENFVVGLKNGVFLLALKRRKGFWLIRFKQKIKSELAETIRNIKVEKHEMPSVMNNLLSVCYDYIPSAINRKNEIYVEPITKVPTKFFFKPRYGRHHYIIKLPIISKKYIEVQQGIKLAKIHGTFIIPDIDGKIIEGRGIGYYIQMPFMRLHEISDVEKVLELIGKLRREKI